MALIALFLCFLLGFAAADGDDFDHATYVSAINQPNPDVGNPIPKNSGSARWDSSADTSSFNTYVQPATDASFYTEPVPSYYNNNAYPAANYYGGAGNAVTFGVREFVTTAISLIVGVFVLSFVIKFLQQIFSKPLSDLFKARSIDADTISEITNLMLDAYEKFNQE